MIKYRMGRRHRQFYFASRSLRISLFIIVLFSLATVLLFTFAVKEVGEFLEKRGFHVQGNIVALAIVITGYALIVFGLTYFFSHRFIGPFERLKTDMSIIRDGFYHRRLITRDGDDVYIRSFVDEVNKMLGEFEVLCRSRDVLQNIVDGDLKDMAALLEDRDASDEMIREKIMSLKKKLDSLIKISCKPLKEDQ
jgi:hypothetical protein